MNKLFFFLTLISVVIFSTGCDDKDRWDDGCGCHNDGNNPCINCGPDYPDGYLPERFSAENYKHSRFALIHAAQHVDDADVYAATLCTEYGDVTVACFAGNNSGMNINSINADISSGDILKFNIEFYDESLRMYVFITQPSRTQYEWSLCEEYWKTTPTDSTLAQRFGGTVEVGDSTYASSKIELVNNRLQVKK